MLETLSDDDYVNVVYVSIHTINMTYSIKYFLNIQFCMTSRSHTESCYDSALNLHLHLKVHTLMNVNVNIFVDWLFERISSCH